LQMFANYTLTEEFEAQPENIRQGILMYAQYISEKLSAATAPPLMPGGPPPPPNGPGAPAAGGQPPGHIAPGPHHPPGVLPPSELAKKGGIGGQPAPHVLGQVPGLQVTPMQVQGAATREAANIVPNVSPSA
jgi:hypothetical protein